MDPEALLTILRRVLFVEGIYNVSMWDAYDKARWNSTFHCPTRQAFGDPVTSAAAWQDGSPSVNALSEDPLAPLLLIHSPGDDWVQSAQAVGLYKRLQPPLFGGTGHSLDVKGKCVAGQHPQVLEGKSAASLAGCMLAFLAAQG